MTRQSITTDAGEEIQCAKCEDYWPKDPEFFYFTKGSPHSWCKDCYINDPATREKNKRYADKQAAQRAQERAAA